MTDSGGPIVAQRHHPTLPDDWHGGLGEAMNMFRNPQESPYSTMNSSDYDYPMRYGSTSQESCEERSASSAGLTTRESFELFQEAVDTARDEYQKTLTGIDGANETLKPKLTVDIRHRGLSSIPKEVIAIIRQDVERLHLAHNQLRSIAYEFSNCSALKYLNLRDNRLKEIPRAIFGLPQMEILDLSRNRLSEIPNDIKSMKALRVFSIQHNSIEDLPNCLGNTSTLRMLKMTGNPWKPGIKRILEATELSPSQPSASGKDDNERDTLLTGPIKEYLRSRAVKDSGEEASDEPLETPRAQTRFPIQPRATFGHYTSGSESASDLRSPGFVKPALSNRSHHRAPSSHNNALQIAPPRRPGLAPLALGNERNRSNSESYLQATQNSKSRRMGIVTKRNADFGVLDETRTNRNSYHLRGQSHGSALRKGVRAGEGSPSELASPPGSDRQRGMNVRRLSSLPEIRREEWPTDNTIEAAKGILYSLHLIHPTLSIVTSVIRDGKSKPTQMERAFDAAVIRVENLDQELLDFDRILDQSSESGKRLKKSIASATHACILAHQQFGSLLVKGINQLVEELDPRYIRTLMLMLYGSLNEMSNASRSVGSNFQKKISQKNGINRVSTITEAPNEGEIPSNRDDSVTPTQERLKPERRWRQGSTVQHHQTSSHSNLKSVYSAQGSTLLFQKGRSRSNSRAGVIYSSAYSSVASTPLSGETFNHAPIAARSRSGSINVTPEQARMENGQIAQFEKIFNVLKKATDEGLQVVHVLEPYFLHGLEESQQQYMHGRIRDIWTTLVAHSRHCIEMSETLKMRLSTIRLNDSEARNARDFWLLVQRFLDSYSNLLLCLKEARRHNLIIDEMKDWVRSIHTSIRKAAALIAESSWNRLTFETDLSATPRPQSQLPTQIPLHNGYQQHRAKGSGGSTAGSSTSPYSTNVPATPLSAALGPAAQATMPATPASASLERSFEGDIFQRADTLQKQQTMIHRR